MYSLSPLLTSFSRQSTLTSLSSCPPLTALVRVTDKLCAGISKGHASAHMLHKLAGTLELVTILSFFKHFSPWEAMTPYSPRSPSVFLPVSPLSSVPLFLGPVSKVKMPQDLIFLLSIFSLGLSTIDMLITPESSVRIHTASNQKSNSVSIKVVYWLT